MVHSIQSPERNTHTEFAKELGLKEAISIAVGAMIGGGIFSVLGRLSHMAGPAASISFFFGGIIAFLTSNSYYRLVSKYPSAGGEFTILRRGYQDPMVGNIIGMMLWLGYSVTIALYAFTFGLYSSEFLHDLTGNFFFATENTGILSGRRLFAFLSILTFMIINLRGVKESGSIQNLIVVFKLGVLLFVGLLGFIYFQPNKYVPFTLDTDPYEFFPKDPLGGFSGVVIGSAVIFVSYEGFQVIANTVEEMKNPAKDVKLGMYISVITVTITYIIVTIATFSLVKDPHNIDEAALIQAVEFVGPWAVLLVTLGAVASTSSAINATLLGSSRLAYVMSDYEAFPKKLSAISRKTRVPYMAIITTSGISWFFTFFGNAEEIAEVGSIIFLGIYLTINYTVIRVFKNSRNIIAKTAFSLIIIYIILVFTYFFTHMERSLLALVVLTIFISISVGYMYFNKKFAKGEIDSSKYELEPLGKELIKEFRAKGIQTDDFFIGLERMLVPVSCAKFETMSWEIAAQIARKYRVKATLLHVGLTEKPLIGPREIFDKYQVDYDIIHKTGTGRQVAKIIIKTYYEGNYQLIAMASHRRKGLFDRLFVENVSKTVIDNIDGIVLQIHPARYAQKRVDIKNMFMLLDGSERDYYLARWAKVISNVADLENIFAYHAVIIPQTISLEDAAELPEIKSSEQEFSRYATMMGLMLNMDVTPIILYGHNFVKSLYQATKQHEPEIVLIGHTHDSGLWNKIRTRLAYRIMRKLDSAVLVHHTGKKYKKFE